MVIYAAKKHFRSMLYQLFILWAFFNNGECSCQEPIILCTHWKCCVGFCVHLYSNRSCTHTTLQHYQNASYEHRQELLSSSSISKSVLLDSVYTCNYYTSHTPHTHTHTHTHNSTTLVSKCIIRTQTETGIQPTQSNCTQSIHKRECEMHG